MSIGDNIRKYRNAKGISQKELGRISNTAETTVRQYEGGKRTPRIEQIEKIAKALEVTPFQLMGTVYWDTKHPELNTDATQYEAFVSLLEALNYVVDEVSVPVKEIDGVPGETFEFNISSGKKTVTFTELEFEELQNLLKEVIEAKFYKKLAERKK